jgi:hypothetical protein
MNVWHICSFLLSLNVLFRSGRRGYSWECIGPICEDAEYLDGKREDDNGRANVGARICIPCYLLKQPDSAHNSRVVASAP